MKKGSWDVLAKDYDSLVSEKGDIYHQTYLNPLMLKILGNFKGKKILDLACGNGYFSRVLEKKGAKVFGIDYSSELIKIAKTKSEDNSKIRFFEASSSNLKMFNKNYFDVIVSNVAFMDIRDISGTLKECSRVLKDKGKIIFSITHPVFHLSERNKERGNYFQKIKKYMSVFEVNHYSHKDVYCYHRPIEYYMKILFKNKFFVSGFYEIPTKFGNGQLIRNPEELSHKLEIPSFLIIEAIKIE